jgi:hypothetical protein
MGLVGLALFTYPEYVLRRVVIDGIKLPAVMRGVTADKYLAVHMVQMRLLSKFPPNIPADVMHRFTMVGLIIFARKLLIIEHTGIA